MTNFYQNLQSYNNFNNTFDSNKYIDVPPDWFVIITDIEDSTLLINAKRYKEVNTIGAACMAAIERITGIDNFPASFGGDGATVIIPDNLKDSVLNELSKVKLSALNRFNISLRIGVVPVSDILNHGYKIEVAKFEISHKRFTPKFKGGGINFADELIKNNVEYQDNRPIKDECNFDNLSCRWQPIPNSNGTILTLIIYTENFDNYALILKEITNITGKPLDKLNPVHIFKMKYKGLLEMIKTEFPYTSISSFKSFFLRICEITLCYFLFRIFRPILPKKLKTYAESMRRYSDYRKYDDSLRLVLDCTKSNAHEIIEYLSYQKDIAYGFQMSDSALMTCLVTNLEDGGHIHFIDGNDGGYTQASKSFKKRLNSLLRPNPISI